MAQEIIHQIQITGPGIDQALVLPPGVTTVGRHSTNQLVLAHPLVSRRHAQITCTEDACTITDLGSTHGTMVNRARIEPDTPHPLNAGDVIEIGAFRFTYEPVTAGEPEPEPPESSEPSEDTPPEIAPTPEEPIASPTAPLAQDWAAGGYVPYSPPQPASNGHKPFTVPAGLSLTHSSYMAYLPDIYLTGHQNFMMRFLALLESILAPIEWSVNNFDLFLDPLTAPAGFLPWLANWFDLTFDRTWSEGQQRQLLFEAQKIYCRRGTAWALQRILEIYTGEVVEIDDQNPNLDHLTFSVRILASEQEVNRIAVEQIINANKPAHTSYSLMFIS